VHPILTARYVEGAFYTLFEKLIDDERKFFNYFRMSFSTFTLILDKLSDVIRRNDTQMCLYVPSKEMLAVTQR
jgi:hypothetical protein